MAPNPIMPILVGTFGDDWSCVERFLASNKDKPHALEVHITNQSCHRLRRCKKGEIGTGDTAAFNRALLTPTSPTNLTIETRIRDLESRLSKIKNNNTTILVSSGLEDQYCNKCYSSVYNLIRTYIPYAKIIRNTILRNQSFVADYVESHFLWSKCDANTIISNDGYSLNLSSVRRYRQFYSNCRGAVLWISSLQWGEQKFFLEPLRRKFRISVREKLMWYSFIRRNNAQSN